MKECSECAGIPELDVPSLSGLQLDEVVVSPAGSSYRIVGKNLVVTGAENFRVFRLK